MNTPQPSSGAIYYLRPFSTVNPASALRLSGEFTLAGETALLRYVVGGPWHTLVLAAKSAKPAFTPNLWQITCFEFFLAREGGLDYLEFNFSPSGDYAWHLFDDYRHHTKCDPPPSFAPLVTLEEVDQGAAELVLCARFSMRTAAALLGGTTKDRFLINIAAVTLAKDGSLNHFALSHPAGRADFHRRECFISL